MIEPQLELQRLASGRARQGVDYCQAGGPLILAEVPRAVCVDLLQRELCPQGRARLQRSLLRPSEGRVGRAVGW